MKHFLWTALAAVLFSSPASAAFVACTPMSGGLIINAGVAVAGGANFLCSPDPIANNMAGDGISVGGIQLRTTVQGSSSTPGFFFNAFTTNLAGFNNPAPIACGTSGTTAGPVSGLSAVTAVPCLDVIAPFIVNVQAVSAGAPFPDQGLAIVEYDTVACELPEPSTCALLGVALAATAALQRRRQRNQR